MDNKKNLEPLFGLVELKPTVESENVWYESYLLDVNNIPSSENDNTIVATIVLSVKDEPASLTISQKKNLQNFPIEQIRLKPKNFEPVAFRENNIIEVRVVDENKFITWKLARINKVKDANALVEYFDEQNQIVEAKNFELNVISCEDARCKNPFQPFDGKINPFVRVELRVPDFLLKNDTQWLNDVNCHSQFKTVENLFNIHYDDDLKSLICLGYVHDGAEFSKQRFINHCNMLSSWHFRALKETHWMAKYKNLPSNESVLHVPVDVSLVGLAIGKGGSNINQARSLEGVKSIELVDNINTFIIRGDSMKACQNAASLLNFKEDDIQVQIKHQEFLSNTRMLHEMVSKSGIVQFNIFTACPRRDDESSKQGGDARGNKNPKNLYNFHVIGNEESINNFRLMLLYQCSEYGEIEELRNKFKGLLGTTRPRNNPPISQRRRSNRNFADVLKS